MDDDDVSMFFCRIGGVFAVTKKYSLAEKRFWWDIYLKCSFLKDW